MVPGWEEALHRAVQPAVEGLATEYQQMFDSLLRRYKGHPVSEVKLVLRSEWSRIGGSISDPELTEFATAISEGTRIVMRA